MEKKLHLIYHKKRCQIIRSLDESKKHNSVARLKFPHSNENVQVIIPRLESPSLNDEARDRG